MRYQNIIKSLTAASLLASASFASAGLIDFTNETPWKGADNKTSFISGNVTVQTPFGRMTFNDGGNEPVGCNDGSNALSLNLACDGDGLGVVDDEISGTAQQQIIVEFAGSNGVAQQLIFLDLFTEGPQSEQAEFVIVYDSASNDTYAGNVNLGTDFGLTENPGGIWVVDLLGLGVRTTGIEKIIFDAQDDDGLSDVALAGIVTPLPAAVWLFGSALLGLAGFSRARRRKLAVA